MFRNFGIWELLLVLLIIILIFGATRLPQVGAALGKAIRYFRKGLSGDESAKDDLSKTDQHEKEDVDTKRNIDK